MARDQRPALVLDDMDKARLHISESRSGRTLVLTVSNPNYTDARQFQLTRTQAEELEAFLHAINAHR